jgi:hypothetical protein
MSINIYVLFKNLFKKSLDLPDVFPNYNILLFFIFLVKVMLLTLFNFIAYYLFKLQTKNTVNKYINKKCF